MMELLLNRPLDVLWSTAVLCLVAVMVSSTLWVVCGMIRSSLDALNPPYRKLVPEDFKDSEDLDDNDEDLDEPEDYEKLRKP